MKIINLGAERLASEYAAIEIVKAIINKPTTTLGLATGNTMINVYHELVKLINLNQLNLSSVHTFNLDEYMKLGKGDKESYHSYMYRYLFDHNETWNKDNIHIPNGKVRDITEEIKNYETHLSQDGPVDIQLLGIGENGHIGFNEPGASFDSTTRVVNLTKSTLNANRQHFNNEADIPTQAISMGLKSIMSAQRIILLAFGEKKREAIQRLVEGEISEDLPASILHHHPDVEVVVDDEIYKYLNI
ncbi:glucosamine-6-phosphate deaminase [Staphylococcus sp. SQ8-PEA]|uniref:Glucosamine-6-phosphate deaminase n=1 Tax=Staphylococcus marylandisciuri TaxID=2981529 RepID=A0ABT2QN60_9STAP|nr:glucosamine-6-phosphate deaminase [Staphylococcus marylandisciuri]MCU5745416.1 glucosamine-6-phosphate deaminase [Staphylococcus marylandisciuri]